MLPVIVVIGIIVALFPFIIGAIDQYLYNIRQAATSAEEIKGSEGIVVLKDSVSSSTGSDTLVVTPGSIWVPYGGTFTLKITVYFKHSQPCPYSDWSVSYSVDGDLQVVDETEGGLINSKTYVKEVTFQVFGNGSITVVFKYGSGCPEGDEERVVVTVYTGEHSPESISSETISESMTITTTEEREYINITGYIESIDYSGSSIVVDGYTIYLKGIWSDGSDTYERKDVIALLNINMSITVLCYRSGSGRLMAEKIIFDNVTLTRI